MPLHTHLIQPKSIVVVGGSENPESPGGGVLKNLITHQFKGELYVVNPKNAAVQGQVTFAGVHELPQVDLAILAIPAKYIPETVKILCEEKGTMGFIVFSAGFSEKDRDGAALERELLTLINQYGASLLGPNNIGLLNTHYAGVFTQPVPKLNSQGADLISGSGATAVFIMEAAQNLGIQFASVFTVGNGAQLGVEEILAHLDETYVEGKSSKVKMLYLETLKNPKKFLKHCQSLVQKGCSIAAIKAGKSEAGNRAASSHTGAMASPEIFVEALFEKAGIIRCNSRYEMLYTTGILLQKELLGKSLAIITHAGGPAVLLTDALSESGLEIPTTPYQESRHLISQLYEGASVSNPIDILATGTAEQLAACIDFCENDFKAVDGIAVIFGSPGLGEVDEAYAVLSDKMKTCRKPIYPILPSVINAKKAMTGFLKKGNILFNDEVLFGQCLGKVVHQNKPVSKGTGNIEMDEEGIRKIIKNAKSGYLDNASAYGILRAAGISMAEITEVKKRKELLLISQKLPFPVAMKVVGPLHKSDVQGVKLNIKNQTQLVQTFNELMEIEGAEAVLLQPMQKGTELFIGAKREVGFPPLVLCGLGGVFIEVLKDIQSIIPPISDPEVHKMVKKLKAYPILKGVRGKPGVNIQKFEETIQKVGQLMDIVPEIQELDINPLMATSDNVCAVDVRIRIEK